MPATKLDRSDPRTPRARSLRKDATPAERKLWSALRLIGVPQGHFRRQAPIGPYIADFAHHGLRIVVELDGEQHGYAGGLRRDAKRTAYLAAAGYRVLRFWNHEVIENLDGVVETVLAALVDRPPTPALPATRFARGGREMPGATPRRDRESVSVPLPRPPGRSARGSGEGAGGGRIRPHQRTLHEGV
jgi:very-short-patch-repair endonuclease